MKFGYWLLYFFYYKDFYCINYYLKRESEREEMIYCFRFWKEYYEMVVKFIKVYICVNKENILFRVSDCWNLFVLNKIYYGWFLKEDGIYKYKIIIIYFIKGMG